MKLRFGDDEHNFNCDDILKEAEDRRKLEKKSSDINMIDDTRLIIVLVFAIIAIALICR